MRLQPKGFTLLEVTLSLVTSALIITVLLTSFYSGVRFYINIQDQNANTTSLTILDTLLQNDLHASLSLSNPYGSYLYILEPGGGSVSYHLNLNSQIIREVNGSGGEVVASNVKAFDIQLLDYNRTLGLNISFLKTGGVNSWQILISSGNV